VTAVINKMLLTSNIKEYIQGCISVLFSYKIGNVLHRSCKAGVQFSALNQPIIVALEMQGISCSNFDIVSHLFEAVNIFLRYFSIF